MSAINLPTLGAKLPALKSAARRIARKSETIGSGGLAESVAVANRMATLATEKVTRARAAVQEMSTNIDEVEMMVADATTRINELQDGDYPQAADDISNELRDLTESLDQIIYA